jgi:hypothetical protein
MLTVEVKSTCVGPLPQQIGSRLQFSDRFCSTLVKHFVFPPIVGAFALRTVYHRIVFLSFVGLSDDSPHTSDASVLDDGFEDTWFDEVSPRRRRDSDSETESADED